MKFEEYNISEEIKQSLAELEYLRPTDIQYKAIPSILKGEDVMAIAQTGTGKTAAFAIPILHLLQKRKGKYYSDNIRCVVLAPTHELAQQITGVFHQIGCYTSIRTVCITGGVEQDPQIAELAKGVDILVATPGRLFDLKSQGHIKVDRVGILVLDEADHMLDLGFIKDIDDLIRVLPPERQTLFFSATLDHKIKKVAYSVVRNPIRIQISPKDPVAKNIDHSVAFIEMDDKRFFLERLIKENPESKIIVFVRTIVRAERVSKAMGRVDLVSDTLHREKPEAERQKIMRKFKSGELKLLITTDISARGIDVPNVDYVVNYDIPKEAENYVHRVGRTGRAKKKGLAISFCSPDEKPMLEKIESFLQKPINVLTIDKENYTTTLELVHEHSNDWQALMEEIEKVKEFQGKAKKKQGATGKGKKKKPKNRRK